ncbi:hypothetical protein DESC_190063 [Desulfosarcina cetonica]|nr:hypothetical protein DESC_190063 [Desulfosarcina cetonica]
MCRCLRGLGRNGRESALRPDLEILPLSFLPVGPALWVDEGLASLPDLAAHDGGKEYRTGPGPRSAPPIRIEAAPKYS